MSTKRAVSLQWHLQVYAAIRAEPMPMQGRGVIVWWRAVSGCPGCGRLRRLESGNSRSGPPPAGQGQPPNRHIQFEFEIGGTCAPGRPQTLPPPCSCHPTVRLVAASRPQSEIRGGSCEKMFRVVATSTNYSCTVQLYSCSHFPLSFGKPCTAHSKLIII